MAANTIDTKLLQKMFLSGAANLKANKEWINDLNVFPVPDGDTGTNMTLTILSAAREVSALADPDMKVLAKAISSGSLRGARGNSGVILSQLFRGFTKEISAVDKIDVHVLANAFERAVETAYKAVMKPKEGTILTVAKGAAQKASEMADITEDIEQMMVEILAHAEYVLSQTPEMLPVLKEAGVVDSGGQGLVEVMRGALLAFQGKGIALDMNMDSKPASGTETKTAAGAAALGDVEIKFGYCTEFIIMLEKEFDMDTELKFKAFLESIGDSIVCVSDDEVVKVHVHTNDPGLAIQKALTFGQLTSMKIDNMREEHNQKVIAQEELNAAKADSTVKTSEVKEVKPKELGPKKDFGFVTVVAGDGLSEIFKGLGVDYVIEGGQTMNPSTDDILQAVEQVNADTVFILPNNSNVILAAQQAADICEDKMLVVIPSKTVPQGVTAMICFELSRTMEENRQAMIDGMANVKSGEVTYAVRDTSIDGHAIHCNDIMGLGDAGLITVGNDVKKTVLDMLTEMVDEDSELVSLYYGSDVTEAQADELTERVAEMFPDLDVETQRGGQPIYYYILSVE